MTTAIVWLDPSVSQLELTAGERERVSAAVADVAARLASEHSRRAYAQDWRAWCVWCEHVAGIPILEARPTDVQRHLVDLTDNGAAKKSVQRRLTVLRQVYGSLEIHHLIARNPAREVRTPANHRPTHRPWLRSDQLAQLVRSCGGSSWVEQRDRLVILLLATTGLRRAELARLTPANVQRIDFGALVIAVSTKGGKSIVASVPSGVDAILEQWVDAARAEHGQDAGLWLRDGKQISDGQIGAIVRRAAMRAGLEATPHALRRTFATLASLSGVELRELQAALGHAQSSTTELYVRSAVPVSSAAGEAVARSLETQRAPETCVARDPVVVPAQPGRAKP